jgi:glutaredoxin 3
MTDAPAGAAGSGKPKGAELPRVVMYSKWGCGYCMWAQRLLDGKGVTVEHINVTFRPAAYREMVQRSGGRTSAPQIFIADRHVGGYRELVDLDASGALDRMLAGAGVTAAAAHDAQPGGGETA